MNWFQKLLTNPNAHLLAGAAAFAASFIPAAAPFVPVLNAITGATTVTGAMLPGGAIIGERPATPPPPAPTLHREDYANIAAALILAQKAQAQQAQGLRTECAPPTQAPS